MYYNSYNENGFGVQILTRTGLLFFLWLACIAYTDLSPNSSVYFLLEEYYLYFVGYAVFGCVFYLKTVSKLIVFWRFFLELFFCAGFVSYPLQVFYFNGWLFLCAAFIFILIVYSSIYFMRFVYWQDFKRTLITQGKLSKYNEFSVTRGQYLEVYELSKKLQFLKKTAFWENGFFSNEVRLESSKSLATVRNIALLSGIALMIWMAVVGTDVYGLASAVIVILILPQFIRISIAPALLDLLLCCIFKFKDSIKF